MIACVLGSWAGCSSVACHRLQGAASPPFLLAILSERFVFGLGNESRWIGRGDYMLRPGLVETGSLELSET